MFLIREAPLKTTARTRDWRTTSFEIESGLLESARAEAIRQHTTMGTIFRQAVAEFLARRARSTKRQRQSRDTAQVREIVQS